MSGNKTVATTASVHQFIQTVADERKRRDCRTLNKIMGDAVGRKGRMWGPSIIGFGSYHYKYDSGREGDAFLTGFSPRAQNMTVYIMPGFSKYEATLKKLGKHKLGKSCLYIKKLEDVDLDILTDIIKDSVEVMNARYNS